MRDRHEHLVTCLERGGDMGGIAGFTAPGAAARPVLAAMNRALAHRGPAGGTSFIDRGIAFGHSRLAAGEPGGAQPRVDPATGDALVFDGRIYGHQVLADALRRSGVVLRDGSECEVLFQLIRRHGVAAAVARIEGMFAFAYRDGATGALHLVRDRFGEKPLYWGMTQGSLVFGSEVSALLCHPGLRGAAPDRSAAYALMRLGHLPGRLSGWEGIRKIEPGTMLSAAGGRVAEVRYWRPPVDRGGASIDENEAADRLHAMFREAVRRRVTADRPTGILLSGGIESCVLAGYAAHSAPNLTLFSLRHGGGKPRESAVARRLGLRHEAVELGVEDLVRAVDAIGAMPGEPCADPSVLPSWVLCRAMRGSLGVALGTAGADELFAGHRAVALQRFAPALRRFPERIDRMVGRLLGGSFQRRRLDGGGLARVCLWPAPFERAGLDALWRPEALPADAADNGFGELDRRLKGTGHLSDIEALAYLVLAGALPDEVLLGTDRAAMGNALELRAPFLDRAVAEFAASLPMRLKLRRFRPKYLLYRVAARHLPVGLGHDAPRRFEIGPLLRGDLRERVRDQLLSRDNPVAEWFERAAIERLLGAHEHGRADHGSRLWTLYSLFAVAQTRAVPLLAKTA